MFPPPRSLDRVYMRETALPGHPLVGGLVVDFLGLWKQLITPRQVIAHTVVTVRAIQMMKLRERGRGKGRDSWKNLQAYVCSRDVISCTLESGKERAPGKPSNPLTFSATFKDKKVDS